MTRTYYYTCPRCTHTRPMRWYKTLLACRAQGMCHSCLLRQSNPEPTALQRLRLHAAMVRDSLTIADGERGWTERLKQRAQRVPDNRPIYLRIHAKRLAYYRALLRRIARIERTERQRTENEHARTTNHTRAQPRPARDLSR